MGRHFCWILYRLAITKAVSGWYELIRVVAPTPWIVTEDTPSAWSCKASCPKVGSINSLVFHEVTLLKLLTFLLSSVLIAITPFRALSHDAQTCTCHSTTKLVSAVISHYLHCSPMSVCDLVASWAIVVIIIGKLVEDIGSIGGLIKPCAIASVRHWNFFQS